MFVSNQRGEDLGQLSLQVGVELGFDVEAVHVGKYRDDATQGMEVLDQSLGKQLRECVRFSSRERSSYLPCGTRG